ncbi:hypothetical protein NYZ99_00915 [Maribacter litopenaei]|uniref:Uncharacterized protein n=1 Tax=Maribacter litopenaei TaxID=2976127 RepID=A0ABY5Y8R0_9FLAO|nr:hypothetical protein [Maribacter litopenaei]UWX55221.1 hypothetical protein NYZ99_00915 [Maribacter litopenaei]
MKKLSVLLGIGILGVLLISAKATNFCVDADHNPHVSNHNPFAEGLQIEMESANPDASEIVLLEEEEEVDLGFDTAEYLPLGFNAYEGMELDVEDIVILEDEEEVDLGFDVAPYLPENFDAYAK